MHLPAESGACLQVYTALISACSREILEAPPSNRRLQLVLLERAQGVLAEMRNARLPPDPFLWNALIAAAGRAGQLQRAFQNMDDMQVGWRPLLQHFTCVHARQLEGALPTILQLQMLKADACECMLATCRCGAGSGLSPAVSPAG